MEVHLEMKDELFPKRFADIIGFSIPCAELQFFTKGFTFAILADSKFCNQSAEHQ